jgi:phosphate-selective porin OprO/OprP
MIALFGAMIALFCQPVPVSADELAERLLDVLRDNGTISAEQYRSIRSADGGSADAVVGRLIEALHAGGVLGDEDYRVLMGTAAEGGGPGPRGAEHGPAPSASVGAQPGPVVADAGGAGLTVDVDEGGLSIESADGERFFELGGRIHVDAGWFDDDGAGIGNGSEVRRVRLEWKGGLGPNWLMSGGVDFAEEEVSLKSTYVRYLGFEPLYLQIGNFKEAYSLERLMSSNYSTFMERAAPVTAFAPGRNIGVAVGSSGESWSANGGVFLEGTDNDNDAGVNESWALTGRATYAPIHEKTRVVHLGAAASMRFYDDDDEVRFRERFETHLTDVRLVDTGDLTGIDSIARVGAELAGVYGPFSVQGEYFGTDITRDGSVGEDAYLNGWYTYASWLLTGESRRYKAAKGLFTGVKPNGAVGEGGLGAWELAARFSRLDLSDDDIAGGRQDILTVGLNWYARENLRFMANYVDVLEVTGPNAGVEPSVFQIRTALHF